MNHGLDTDEQVFFYEQEFYPLSNFSAFTLHWKGRLFYTSEHAYHWEKFPPQTGDFTCLGETMIAIAVRQAPSAHEAFALSRKAFAHVRSDWDAVKVDIMRKILWAKVRQHEYVKKKLLESGDRDLVENSWRDDFWGWGPNHDGQNMLGKLWMEIRAELRKQ